MERDRRAPTRGGLDVARAVDALRAALSPAVLEVQALPIDDTCVTLHPTQLLPAVSRLVEDFGLRHLSTITGDDTGQGITLSYHFWDGHGLTLRTVLPYSQPVIATLTAIIPGAAFYEREVADMLGVTFEGAAVSGPLLLPDDWDGPPPMRRPVPDSAQNQGGVPAAGGAGPACAAQEEVAP